MSERILRIWRLKGSGGASPVWRLTLFLAVSFILFPGWPVKAQDAGGGGGTARPASALPRPAAHPSSPSLSDIYLINPYDQLDVYVYDVPELSHIYTVSPSGTVTVPLLSEPITAAGLTPDQFARSMEEAFQKSGRLRRPEIAISVKQSKFLSVAVDGAVRSPQVLTEMAPTRLVEILTQCGGLADDAGTSVTITRGNLALKDLARQGEQASPISTVELKKVLDGHDAASTLMIWPGDRVSVGRSGVYYVLGEVRTLGISPKKWPRGIDRPARPGPGRRSDRRRQEEQGDDPAQRSPGAQRPRRDKAGPVKHFGREIDRSCTTGQRHSLHSW